MISTKRAVLAGTTRRTYLAELGNYYLWGNTIINKDLSVTSSPTKSFSPVEVATDDDNTSTLLVRYRAIRSHCLEITVRE
jgi:hypothetical protein